MPLVERELARLAEEHSKQSYYQVRDWYNTEALSAVRRAAIFIYLNKTCFNGLHRVNRKGHFNVPMGRYTNPKILDRSQLKAAQEQLAKADVRCAAFQNMLALCDAGDFVYLDPPYEPMSPTASFTGYTQGGFGQSDQTLLRDVFRELDRRGCKLMLSNSDVPFIRELYAEYSIVQVSADRAINSKATGRGKVLEVVVRNYG